MELTSKRRAELKAKAHELDPVAHIGKYGVTPESLAHIDKALTDHELIKVKFLGFKETRKELSVEIAGATSSALVDVIGNVAILYREKPEVSE
ncbi:MAG: YhbY family RNA-binding protein [Candidatus Bathyarchaeota archaeon]|nr:YhbY family RNA-binding protein [Candidatus Bathyarchaeota archaeon]